MPATQAAPGTTPTVSTLTAIPGTSTSTIVSTSAQVYTPGTVASASAEVTTTTVVSMSSQVPISTPAIVHSSSSQQPIFVQVNIEFKFIYRTFAPRSGIYSYGQCHFIASSNAWSISWNTS